MKKILICALLSLSLLIATPDESRADHCGFWDVTGHCDDVTALLVIAGVVVFAVGIGLISTRSYYFTDLGENNLDFSLSPTYEPDTNTTGLNFSLKY